MLTAEWAEPPAEEESELEQRTKEVLRDLRISLIQFRRVRAEGLAARAERWKTRYREAWNRLDDDPEGPRARWPHPRELRLP